MALLAEMELIKNQITSALEQVTMHGINLKTLGISKVAILSEKNDLSSEDGLVKEYKRLSVQLKQLQILEKRYTDTIENLQKDEITIVDDINKFTNLDVSSIIHQIWLTMPFNSNGRKRSKNNLTFF